MASVQPGDHGVGRVAELAHVQVVNRLVDENLSPVSDRDLAWAEVVMVSGMHVQVERIRQICARATELGAVTVLGGPSVSADPELPFRCEFCDIPALYGNRARHKPAEAVLAELDAMLRRGNPGTIYFVDDNFIADPRAAVGLLTALVEWQRTHGYPVSFACEATVNLAKRTDILALMREASFTTVFVGVESPDLGALRLIRKTQNVATPPLQAVRRLNEYGLEVVAGIIMGLDTDDEQTGERILDFVEASQIPMLTINLLHALPRTPLWDRLRKAGASSTTLVAASRTSNSCCRTTPSSKAGAPRWPALSTPRPSSADSHTNSRTPIRTGLRCDAAVRRRPK